MDALDLFAGSGWGVACKRLGIREMAAEIMPDANATRALNGMETTFLDVWQDLLTPSGTLDYTLLLGSPPCQPFSKVGRGEGLRALGLIHKSIIDGRYEDPEDLFRLGAQTDHKSSLVLTPLAYAWRDLPQYIVLEQVPTVLPVWEEIGVALEEMNYSVWTGLLNAEQYGVPQTRQRAFLIARADGIQAAPPAPTHSRFYTRDPERLDPGVLPWVSMAQAVGWGFTHRPAPTQTGHGYASRQASGQQQIYRTAIEAGQFIFRPPFTAENARISDDPISLSRAFEFGAINNSPDEAKLIQSYPADFKFGGERGSQFLQIGNAVPPLLAEAILRIFPEPSAVPTHQ